MRTVRCPSCQRALNLPEDTPAESARCPACHAVFAVGQLEEQRPRPSAVPGLVGVREDRAPSEDFNPRRLLDVDEERSEAAVQGSLLTACRWLKAMTAFAMFQIMTCGVCGLLRSQEQMGLGLGELWTFLIYASLMVCRLATLLLIYHSAERLGQRRSITMARTGAIVALLYAVLSPLLFALLEDFGRPHRDGDPGVLVAAVVLSLAPSLCGLVGSILALRLLSRPEVERAFRP